MTRPTAGPAGPAAPEGVRDAPKPWPVFDVTVDGYGVEAFAAPSRGKALSKAWNSDAFSHIGFGDFLKIARARKRTELLPDGYAYVRSAYGVDVRHGQVVALQNEGERWNGREGVVLYPGRSTASVHVLFAGMDRPVIVHPDSVVVAYLAATAGADTGAGR